MTHYPTPPTEAPTAGQLTPAPAPVELPAGATQRVGDYRLLSILGTGGMGVVYKAFDQKLGRVVALKMLQVGLTPEPEELVRFRGEAETLGSLQHPHIVQIYDFGMHDGMPFLVMEYINGGGLDGKLAGQPQPPRRAAELIETLARAIQVAHDKGIIHRDLKPGNVLLTADGTPKITDFGLAKRLEAGQGLTQTGAVMGTPSYMAPEQAQGLKDVGPAADVYALGAILYELLTGRPPFRGATLPETLEQVCQVDPAPPSRLVARVPHDLSTICLKCLHKAPARRYDSAVELADDLRNWLEGMPIRARSMPAIERAWRVVARRPLQAALAACATLLVVMLVVFALVLRDMSQRDALEQERQENDRIVRDKDEEIKQLTERKNRYIEGELDHALGTLEKVLGVTLDGTDLSDHSPLQQHLLDYYQQLAGRGAKDESFVKPTKLAKAFVQLGRLAQRMGHSDKARDAFVKGEALYRKAGLERLPAEDRLAYARLLKDRGSVLRGLGKLTEAERDYAEGLKVIAGLPRADREAEDARRAEGEVLHGLGALLAGRGRQDRVTDARKAYARALAIRKGLVARRPAPEDEAALAQTYGFLGDLLLGQGQLSEADDCYWHSHRIRLNLAGPDGAPEARFQLARSLANLGGYQVRAGALSTARDFYEQARKVREELAGRYPTRAEYQSDLAELLNGLAELSLFDRPEALSAEEAASVRKWLDTSASKFRELHARDRKALGPRVGLANAVALQARLALALRQRPDFAGLSPARNLITETPKEARLPEHHYTLAALWALTLENRNMVPGGAEIVTREAIKELRAAVAAGFSRLRPEEVRRDRAFGKLVKDESFRKLIEPDAPAGGKAR